MSGKFVDDYLHVTIADSRSGLGPFSTLQRVGQLLARSCHTGPDRADGDTAGLGSLGVGHADQLGENERLSSVGVELVEQECEVDGARR